MNRKYINGTVPAGSIARPYRPVEWLGSAGRQGRGGDAWTAAWLAAMSEPSVRALTGRFEWPKISRFAEWNDAGRVDLANISQRAACLIHPAIRPDAAAWTGWSPTRRLAVLAVLAALGCHGRADSAAGATQVVIRPKLVNAAGERVEAIAIEPRKWTVEMTVDLAEKLLEATGDVAVRVGSTRQSRVLRSFDVTVASPNNSYELGCPPGEILSELRDFHRAFQSTIGTHWPTGAVAAWVYREIAKIHPLPDGNGRLARTLASAVLLAGGRPCLILTQRENLALSATLQTEAGRFEAGLVRPMAALEAASVGRIMGTTASSLA